MALLDLQGLESPATRGGGCGHRPGCGCGGGGSHLSLLLCNN